jgi:hypothetical protein
MIKKFVFSILLLSGIAAGVKAQNAASPYSIFGLGTLSSKALTYHSNMGGLGISNGKPWILNNINPALLPMNTFSTFDAGLSVEQRTLTTSELSQSNTTGGLSYLAFAFPIKSAKWTMATGLIPYSSVSYNIITSGNVINREEADADYQYIGSGGINQVYLSSGWVLVPNFLSFGARAAYSFGTVEDESIIDISERVYVNEEDTTGIPKSINSSKFYRSSRYSDFIFDAGLNMRKRFGKNMEVDLGFVYEFATNMNTTRDERLEIVVDSPFPPTDTILHSAKGSTYLPHKFGGGLSFSKAYKWTFGVDFYSRDWSKFKSDFGNEQELTNSYEIIVGGEFTPDFTSVKSYLKRVTYQFGFNYEQTPVEINNNHIDDFGINFGVSLPAGNASIFNFGFKYGQLGTTSDGLIREDYYRIRMGMTFNDRSYGWYRNQNKFK